MAQNPHILLIEDDAAIQDSLTLALEDMGYGVTAVSDGRAGLVAAELGPPAVILVDLRMPVMDGVGFIESYHRQPGPHCPIIVITASRTAPDESKQLPVAAVLAKPFHLEDLFQLIEKLLSDPQRPAL